MRREFFRVTFLRTASFLLGPTGTISFCFTFLPPPILFGTSGPFGGDIFSFCVFTDLILFGTSGASGGSIFLLVKKDRGERHAKGLQSRPLETCFLMRTPFRRALCQPSRNGAIDAIKSASALRLSPRLCVLRCQAHGIAYDFPQQRTPRALLPAMLGITVRAQ